MSSHSQKVHHEAKKAQAQMDLLGESSAEEGKKLGKKTVNILLRFPLTFINGFLKEIKKLFKGCESDSDPVTQSAPPHQGGSRRRRRTRRRRRKHKITRRQRKSKITRRQRKSKITRRRRKT